MQRNSNWDRRTFIEASIAAATAAVAGGAFSQSRAAPIKLGMTVPMSGRMASYGASGVPGAALAVKLVNEKGGISSLGNAPLELVIADTKGDTKVTISETERLINEEKVVGIIGPFSSLDSIAANPLSDQYQIPFVSPYWLSDKAFSLNSRYSRTLNIVSSTYGESSFKFLNILRSKHGLSAKKIGLVYDDSEYGRSVAVAFKTRLEAAGMHLVIDLPVTPQSSEYSATILRLRESGADVLIAAFYFQETVLFLRAADTLKYRVPIIGAASGFSDTRLPGALGSNVAARVFKQIPLFGATTGLHLDSKYRPLQGLIQSAAKETIKPDQTPGVELGWYSLAAQAVYVFKLALEKAASRSGSKINDAILALNLPRGDDMLVLPFYDPGLAWMPNGKPKNQVISFVQWQGDKTVTVYPDDVATAAIKL